MRTNVSILAATLVFSTFVLAPVPAWADHHSAHPASHQGTPPGLAKKGGMPPGLAKKFGSTVPAQAYVAIDPRYDDRAWFLIDGHWVLRDGFDDSLRIEVRSLMKLPPPPRPRGSAWRSATSCMPSTERIRSPRATPATSS